MKTVKKAQLGRLIRKGAEAAEHIAPKVSKWDYPDKAGRDIRRSILEAYPEKAKKLPTGTIDKVKKVKPKYDRHGLEIVNDKNGGKIKAKNGGAVNYKSAGSSVGLTGSGTLKPKAKHGAQLPLLRTKPATKGGASLTTKPATKGGASLGKAKSGASMGKCKGGC